MRLSVLLCVVVSLTAAEFASAENWPQFLGPGRNGVAKASPALIGEFPTQGPLVKWRVPGGVGMSGIAVTQSKCLTIVRRSGQQTLVALDRESGKELWSTGLSSAYDNAMGNGTRATPTVAGNRVFTFTGEGVLSANRLEDGELVWRKDMPRQLSARPSEYGMASSPLVVEDLVIVQVGSPRGSVAAVSADSGEIQWTAGSSTAGYSSPALLQVGGKEQVVAFVGSECLGIAPATGEVQWQMRYVTDYDCNTATPISVKGSVLIAAGENHGGTVFDVRPNGVIQERWRSQGTKADLRAEWQTPLLSQDGLLFVFDNVGSAGPVTNLVCLDATSGDVFWKKRRFGKGNAILADGKLIISTMQGELVLVDASRDAFKELARREVMGKTRQAPSFSDGFVFLRDDQEILCISLRQSDY